MPADPSRSKTFKLIQDSIAEALAAAHHGVWPADQDVQYTVIQRNGKVKIQFSLPASREIGYRDA